VAFALTDAQQRLIDDTRASARDGLPAAAPDETPEASTRRLVRALADVGVLGPLFPATAGGTRPEPSVSALDLCLVREALAQESTEAETALAMQGLGGYPILQAGTPALVERYVTKIARGEAVGAFALTEAEHGTDAGSIELRPSGTVTGGASREPRPGSRTPPSPT
jgi:alkylation response protein AidB-like acyl-CoA dehydrogenase